MHSHEYCMYIHGGSFFFLFFFSKCRNYCASACLLIMSFALSELLVHMSKHIIAKPASPSPLSKSLHSLSKAPALSPIRNSIEPFQLGSLSFLISYRAIVHTIREVLGLLRLVTACVYVLDCTLYHSTTLNVHSIKNSLAIANSLHTEFGVGIFP